jgi:hypothetical protein
MSAPCTKKHPSIYNLQCALADRHNGEHLAAVTWKEVPQVAEEAVAAIEISEDVPKPELKARIFGKK